MADRMRVVQVGEAPARASHNPWMVAAAGVAENCPMWSWCWQAVLLTHLFGFLGAMAVFEHVGEGRGCCLKISGEGGWRAGREAFVDCHGLPGGGFSLWAVELELDVDPPQGPQRSSEAR